MWLKISENRFSIARESLLDIVRLMSLWINNKIDWINSWIQGQRIVLKSIQIKWCSTSKIKRRYSRDWTTKKFLRTMQITQPIKQTICRFRIETMIAWIPSNTPKQLQKPMNLLKVSPINTQRNRKSFKLKNSSFLIRISPSNNTESTYKLFQIRQCARRLTMRKIVQWVMANKLSI